MSVDEYRIGRRLRHKQSKNVLELQDIDGIKLWVNLEHGDTFDWVDEDLYDDLDYFNE